MPTQGVGWLDGWSAGQTTRCADTDRYAAYPCADSLVLCPMSDRLMRNSKLQHSV
jgi:hypothetical protein